MGGILFDSIVFGPVRSRRFGVSLGINVLPTDSKFCTFDCVYCECGWTYKSDMRNARFYSRQEIREAMESDFPKLFEKDIIPDNITFAGNGEPTAHPKFEGIIDDTIEMRNRYFPQAEITVLTNATLLHKESVNRALQKIRNSILKLDTGKEETFQKINRPLQNISLHHIVDQIKTFKGRKIIQTLFVRGKYNGDSIDNTTEVEIATWLNTLRDIQPNKVMIYPIDRSTPAGELERIPGTELDAIAERVRAEGFTTEVYY
ncbi:MAG: radical SAM protein [Bacteroidales bacterium]|nr:radical SAM protein [Bacteroidales bacterium]